MKKLDSIRRFQALRKSLQREQTQLQQRLAALNAALDTLAPPSTSPIDGATTSRKELANGGRAKLPAEKPRSRRKISRS